MADCDIVASTDMALSVLDEQALECQVSLRASMCCSAPRHRLPASKAEGGEERVTPVYVKA